MLNKYALYRVLSRRQLVKVAAGSTPAAGSGSAWAGRNLRQSTTNPGVTQSAFRNQPNVRVDGGGAFGWSPGNFMQSGASGSQQQTSRHLGTFHTRPKGVHQGQVQHHGPQMAQRQLHAQQGGAGSQQHSDNIAQQRREMQANRADRLYDLGSDESAMDQAFATQTFEHMQQQPHGSLERDDAMHNLMLHQGRDVDAQGNLVNSQDLTVGDLASRVNPNNPQAERALLARLRDSGMLSQEEIDQLSGSRGSIRYVDEEGNMQQHQSAPRLPRQISDELRSRMENIVRQQADTRVDPEGAQGTMRFGRA